MTDVPAHKPDPMAEFQAQLQERVRNDIRDLLPADAVAALVQRAIDDEFFKPRQVQDGSWGSRTKEVPSFFVEEVVKAAKPIIEAAVAKFVAEHPEAIEKVIKDFLDTDKLAVATATQLTGMLGAALYDLQQRLMNQ